MAAPSSNSWHNNFTTCGILPDYYIYICLEEFVNQKHYLLPCQHPDSNNPRKQSLTSQKIIRKVTFLSVLHSDFLRFIVPESMAVMYWCVLGTINYNGYNDDGPEFTAIIIWVGNPIITNSGLESQCSRAVKPQTLQLKLDIDPALPRHICFPDTHPALQVGIIEVCWFSFSFILLSVSVSKDCWSIYTSACDFGLAFWSLWAVFCIYTEEGCKTFHRRLL